MKQLMLKQILILKHIDIEGPGSIEEFFENTAWHLKIIDLNTEKLQPKDLSDVEAIISLGGPMNVYKETEYPFIRNEEEFLKIAIKEEVPVLGICLGAQILAKTCGAKVKKASTKEIGWYKINLTEAGKCDPLFQDLPDQLNVFQWHEDTFEIPEGALRLADSQNCANQAFKFGRNAYGLQFHIEVTPQMLESWINKYVNKDCKEFSPKDMIIEGHKRKETFKRQAEKVYLNFSRIITESRKIGVG